MTAVWVVLAAAAFIANLAIHEAGHALALRALAFILGSDLWSVVS